MDHSNIYSKNKKRVVVWDIDSTLAQTAWRLPLIKEKPKNWRKFMADSIHDDPIFQTQFIFHSIMDREDVCSIMMTARSEEEREITSQWLERNNFNYIEMFMREKKDNRPDWEVKNELIDVIEEKYGKIFMAFEDRRNVLVNCYHKRGIFVLDCGQGVVD